MLSFRLSKYIIGFIATLIARGALWGPPDAKAATPNTLSLSVLSAILPLQTSVASCGYAAAAALLNIASTVECIDHIQTGEYSGAPEIGPPHTDISLFQDYKKTPPISLSDIQVLIQKNELQAKAFFIRPSALADMTSHAPLPLVLHLEEKFQHFVLAIDADANYFLIFDPAQGIIVSPHSEIESRASGHVLAVAANYGGTSINAMKIFRKALWSVVGSEAREHKSPDENFEVEELAVFGNTFDIPKLEIDFADEP